MNDTKVQRYEPRNTATDGMYVHSRGEYITHADRTRIVAEKDARLVENAQENAELREAYGALSRKYITTVNEKDAEITRLTTLLAKYQRLHEADVGYDEAVAYLRDIDGTGSLHIAIKGDPGAFPVYACEPLA